METAEEVQAALKEKGLDLSIDDILKIQKTLTSQENGELSEDEMENVAGGFAITAGIVSAIAGVIGATVPLYIPLQEEGGNHERSVNQRYFF